MKSTATATISESVGYDDHENDNKRVFVYVIEEELIREASFLRRPSVVKDVAHPSSSSSSFSLLKKGKVHN